MRRESAAMRWAIALGAGAIALAVALVFAVARLNRWVLRPLASLAGDADRIAGGELAVTPVATRAREVAQVSEALEGRRARSGGRSAPRPPPSASAASWWARSRTTCARRCSRCAARSRRSSTAWATVDALARAQRKADHLDHLVGELFSLARAEYERSAPEELDLADLARRPRVTVTLP